MSRYLVTGATGFLGAHLVRALLHEGHEVVAMVRGDASALEGAPAKLPPVQLPPVQLHRGDILDQASVEAAARGAVGVFHCAGKVSRDPKDAEELHRVHVEGTKSVLAACQRAGVRRAVVASTSGTIAVSDDPERVATEADEAPLSLVSRWPYYRTKLFAERAALSMNGAAFEVVSVNPSLLLGPGDLRGSSTEDIRLFLEGKIPAVPPGGIAFVDARDAAEAMKLAMDRGAPGARYLVSAQNLTLRELFARLERLSGVRAPWLPVPRSPELARVTTGIAERLLGRVGLSLPVDASSLDMAQYYWYADATRAERDLGWRARDPMATLKDTIVDLRARGVAWPSEKSA